MTQQAEAEISRTAEYVIESHVTGHIKAPRPQRAKDKQKSALTLNYTYLHEMEFVVSAVAQVAKLSVKCPLRGTNGASAYR